MDPGGCLAYPSKVVRFLTFVTDFAPGGALPPVVWGSSTSLALYISGVNCTAAFIGGGTISGASAVPRAAVLYLWNGVDAGQLAFLALWRGQICQGPYLPSSGCSL